VPNWKKYNGKIKNSDVNIIGLKSQGVVKLENLSKKVLCDSSSGRLNITVQVSSSIKILYVQVSVIVAFET
jgi:hypothetical protein